MVVKVEQKREDVSFFDRMRLRGNNVESLWKIVEKYEDKKPEFAFQVAKKIMHDPKVFVEVPVGKHRLSGNDFEEYSVKLAMSSNKKVAMMGLDWLAESRHDEWKSDYLKDWVIDRARNPEAKKRAWEMYSKARRGFWDQPYERADKRQAKGEKLYKERRFDDAIKLFDENIKFDPNYAKAWLGKADALQAIARGHDATIALMEISFQKGMVSEENFSSDLSKHNKAISSVVFSASECYHEVIKILEEGRDSSMVEHPNTVILSCKDKLSELFSSRSH